MKHLNLHPWEVSPNEAIQIQKDLKERIILKDSFERIERVAGCDVSFLKGVAYGAVVILNFFDLKPIEEVRISAPIKFPYIPGLLTFREGPVLLKAFEKVNNEPDIILFEGQGIAHPRRMGLASHIGILLDKPSIGCAKTPLWGRLDGEIGKEKGSYCFIKENGEVFGCALRTRPEIKPIFVSPGYKITLKSAIEIVLFLSPKFRTAEPLRLAHTLSKEASCKRYDKTLYIPSIIL
ncbi:MAG: endonuclease V [bacterium]